MNTFIAALVVVLGVAVGSAAATHDARIVSLYGTPSTFGGSSADELIGLKGAFDRHAIVAFRNPRDNEISAFLVPNGIRGIFDPSNVELQALREFLHSDVPKTALTLNSARYLNIPEMSMPVRKLRQPAENLDTSFLFDQEKRQYPIILFVPKDSVRTGNGLLSQLTRLGDFSYNNDNVKIVNDFSIPLNDRENAKTVYGGKYLNPTFGEKDLVAKYINPIFGEKELVTKYTSPILAEKDLFREYVNPIYGEKDITTKFINPIYGEKDLVAKYSPIFAEKDLIRKYVNPIYGEKDLVAKYINPIYGEKGLLTKYTSPIFAEKDLIRKYVNPIYGEEDITTKFNNPIYGEKDLVTKYTRPIFAEKDLGHEYVKPVYTEKGLVSEHVKPFYTEGDLAREYFGSADAEKDLIRAFDPKWILG